MVQPVVHVDQVERAVGEREVLGVGDNRGQVEPVPPRALPRAARGAEGDVRRYDMGACTSE